MTGALMKNGSLETDTHTHTHTHTHTRHVKLKAETGGMLLKPRNAKDCQQTTTAGDRQGTDALAQSSEESNPVTPSISDSGLPNCKTPLLCS